MGYFSLKRAEPTKIVAPNQLTRMINQRTDRKRFLMANPHEYKGVNDFGNDACYVADQDTNTHSDQNRGNQLAGVGSATALRADGE